MRNHVVKANDVKVGGYYLSSHQCDRLGSTGVRENWDGDHGEAQKAKVVNRLNDKKTGDFKGFKECGDFLMSTCTDEEIGSTHIGSFRVQVRYAPCRNVSLVSQQVYDEKSDRWTFRKWNPKKKEIPFGEDNTQVD
jgi:hypothetical protein